MYSPAAIFVVKGFYPLFYHLPVTYIKSILSSISREIEVFRYNSIAVRTLQCVSDTALNIAQPHIVRRQVFQAFKLF